MKTTIYELLGMIKDNNVPKKIYYKNEIFEYDEKEKDYVHIDFSEYLFDVYLITDILNDKVEILETTYKPDKIEKVNTYVLCDSDFHRKCDDGYSLSATEIIDRAFEEYSYKINEIIDYINKEMK